MANQVFCWPVLIVSLKRNSEHFDSGLSGIRDGMNIPFRASVSLIVLERALTILQSSSILIMLAVGVLAPRLIVPAG